MFKIFYTILPPLFLNPISMFFPIDSVLGRFSSLSGFCFGWGFTKINWCNIVTFQLTGTDI